MALLELLNSLTPIAVIALFGVIIYVLVTQGKTTTAQVSSLKDNDLHVLPEMGATLRRIEISQAEAFATIIEKLNGR